MKEFMNDINSIADFWIHFWDCLCFSADHIWEWFIQMIKDLFRLLFWLLVILSSPVWVGPYLIVRSIVKNCHSKKA